MSLEKVVLVTGASSGIGAGIAFGGGLTWGAMVIDWSM